MPVPGGAAPAGEEYAALVAEIWPLDKLPAEAAPRAFEIWRSQVPPANGEKMRLENLAVPARGTDSMVRVRGVFMPPQTGDYTFLIEGKDDAQLWMTDNILGGWTLAQTNGNPIGGPGRNMLNQGVPTRFEFWTMGRTQMSVEWELAQKDSRKMPVVLLTRQCIPASCMRGVMSRPGDRLGTGLPDRWKKRLHLNVDSSEGPDGPWGDPDGDGLPNWLELQTVSHPRNADAEGRKGLVRWEIWRDIPGRYVFDLTRAGNFPQHPDEVRYLRRLETPVGYGDNYGARLRGWIKAPASGRYIFTISAHATAELWLGESESWKSKRLVARAEQAGRRRLLPEQKSAGITLEAGRFYYVEVLQKQQNPSDFCSVSWVRPDQKGSQVVGLQYLVSWQPDPEDADDDGLPDVWQKATGLMAEGVDPTLRSAWADADHDGLTNWEEYKAGSDPLKPDNPKTEHKLTCETWTELPGDRIKDLVSSRSYPAKPDHTTLVDNTDFSDEGENYGCRLRGFLTAPEDGTFSFAVSGHDACVFWLAESENKFTKRVITRTVGNTGWRSYGLSQSQQSGQVELRKGQRYYLEVLFKRGLRDEASSADQRDHCSVAWVRPNRIKGLLQVVDSEYLSPYVPEPRDQDDDDLPDEWERAFGLDPGNPSGANGAWGDPDGDGLENFREFQAGLNPRASDVHGAPGFAPLGMLEERSWRFAEPACQSLFSPQADGSRVGDQHGGTTGARSILRVADEGFSRSTGQRKLYLGCFRGR